MKNDEFVEIINKHIREDVVRIVESDLNSSNHSSKILDEQCKWYSDKSDNEKQIIKKFIRRVYDCAAWRILHMLDDDKEYGGRFELYFVDDDTNEKTLFIDPPNLYELHELYEPEFREEK